MKKSLLVYGIAYFILLTVTLGMLYAYPKLELHLLLNSYHTRLQDIFFTYYSMLAEGPLYVLALLPLLWKQVKLTLFYALCELSGGAVLQLLKLLISMPRPHSAFENCPDMVLPVVEGINLHNSNSFPSGHASTFFVFCTCLAIYLAYRHELSGGKNTHKTCILFDVSLLLLLSLAALGAYSRVYLSQHFLSDVCMGSIIGFVTPCLIFYFGRNKILRIKPKEHRQDKRPLPHQNA
ncbi:MAG: phosphatase PAP2 family protein [Prevotella sp.]|nr:phosphatase PAP2 family protein [Prevotella sp.]MBQ8154628.1 phosphatase PAP2 family protein [Prevotella sp.]